MVEILLRNNPLQDFKQTPNWEMKRVRRKPQNWLWNTWFLQLSRQQQGASLAIPCSSWWTGCESHKQSYQKFERTGWAEENRERRHAPIHIQIEKERRGPENLLDEQSSHWLVSVTMPSPSDTVVRSWPWPRHLLFFHHFLVSMREREREKTKPDCFSCSPFTQ